MSQIPRENILADIRSQLEQRRIVSLLGPRQSGKTTLAKMVAAEYAGPVAYFDLEDPADLGRLAEPMLALRPLTGLVVIDEAQRRPDLFPILRVLADRIPLPCKFLILGSASPEIVKGSSESLAGRVSFIDITGFQPYEVPSSTLTSLWLKGGFPEAFLARDESETFRWLDNFIRTFLEKDLPELGMRAPAEQLRRFWTMVAHCHGQIWNSSEISRSLGVTNKTVRSYVDTLAGAFMVRLLPPWFENAGKRIVKSPKVYLRDSGIFHALMNIRSLSDLQSHPKLGASWEGFALEAVIHSQRAHHDAYFWATHAGAELDLFIIRGGKRYGFEFKYADAPRSTKSMRGAIEDLNLERLYVVYPGDQGYPLGEQIEVISLTKASRELRL